jgi:glycosyltransferase involved in cell wall biosynthesis
LVGCGPEELRLRTLADALGVSSCICFLGEQPDVAPYLAQMDLYVQASVAEGLPNSVLEAMAAGLPVVATAVGGTPEIVLDGQTGLLVAPGDPFALGDAVLALQADRSQAERFGRAGRARVEAYFGEVRMIRQVEALLDCLVARHLGVAFQPSVGWIPC